MSASPSPLSLSEAFVAYSKMVEELELAIEIVNALRARIASREVDPIVVDDLERTPLEVAARAVRAPALADSANRIFFEPRVLRVDAIVACTIWVARGEGELRVVSLDPARVDVLGETTSRTSARGGSIRAIRLRAETGAVEVTFSNARGGESLSRVVQLVSRASSSG